ncbi:MAG: hypothetical protein KGL91_07820 [Xanthomonadaceae bacterium]|nr:hypothetical protein [Xanthomonadaceae bacterium]
MNFSRSLLLIMGCALMAACSQPSAPADGLPNATTASVPPATATAPAATQTTGDGSTPLATFKVAPGQIFACDGRDRVVAKVSWSVKDPSVSTVKVLVSEKNGKKKNLFAAGGNVGEATTENWVVEGTTFFLVAGDDQHPLATYEVTSLPCK